MKTRVSIIFATLNREASLKLMMPSLVALQTSFPFEVICVDNGSDDGTADLIKSYADRLQITYVSHHDKGKNRALNFGLAHATSDLFVFTDDDILPSTDWLEKLYQCTEQNPGFDIFGGTILPHWLKPPEEWIPRLVNLGMVYALTDPDQASGEIESDRVWGPNMAIRRRVFDAGHRFNVHVGPQPGQYIMGSETEFTRRLQSLGYKSYWCSDAIIKHIITESGVDKHWIVNRYYRSGLSRAYRDQQEALAQGATIPTIPAWMYRQYVELYGRALWSRTTRDFDSWFKHMSDWNFHRGYMRQLKKTKETV